MATSLEILKKISDLSSTPNTLSYGIKIAKIAHGLCFAYDTKLVSNVSKGIKKEFRIEKIHANLSFGEKIIKIGPTNPEIICLKLKKKKLTQAKYTSRTASLLSGLNYFIIFQLCGAFYCLLFATKLLNLRRICKFINLYHS